MLVLDAYITVPSTGWDLTVQRTGYSSRSISLTNAGNGYFSAFVDYIESTISAAYAEFADFVTSITSLGYFKCACGAGQVITITWPSELRDILGFSNTPTSISGATGATAQMHPGYRYQSTMLAQDDLEGGESLVNTVYADNAQYTYRYGLRLWRNVGIRFQGYERAVVNNDYISMKRFWTYVLSKGGKFNYYPDTAQSTTQFDYIADPWGYQTYTCTAKEWNPQQLSPGLYRDWLINLTMCPAAP